MKLSIIKSDYLNHEVERMNRWNLCVRIRGLIKTMAAIMAGITIPAVVFKSMNYMLTNCIDDRMSDFTGGITSTITYSAALVLGVGRWIIIMFALLAFLKLLKTGDSKAFCKELLNVVVGWVMLCVLRLLPVCVPVVMRALGLI